MSNHHTVLYLDLENRTSKAKIEPTPAGILGGLGQALAIRELVPASKVIISIGPLTGFFPFCSFTSCLYQFDDRWQELYWGGQFGPALRLAGVDTLVLLAKAETPLSVFIASEQVVFEESSQAQLSTASFQSSLRVEEEGVLVDSYIKLGNRLSYILGKLGVKGISVGGSKSYQLPDYSEYEKVFRDLLGRVRDLDVVPGQHQSCFACPVGCELASSFWESNVPALSSCLVCCPLADKIFEDRGLVFKCLEAVGEKTTHRGLEETAMFVEEKRKHLSGRY